MDRVVQPEWLDSLPPEDPRAIGSRRDLRRLNAWMGNLGIATRAVHHHRSKLPTQPARGGGRQPVRLVDLGAGDGTFCLGLARRLAPEWPQARVWLVDQATPTSPGLFEGFRRIGWEPLLVRQDALAWLGQPESPAADVIVANLFLHHFAEPALRLLLGRIAARTRLVVACEPRRSWAALAASRLLWSLGCNAVTRHDARCSVRAGFHQRELAALWPEATGWRLHEGRAGWFSHLFVAERRNGG